MMEDPIIGIFASVWKYMHPNDKPPSVEYQRGWYKISGQTRSLRRREMWDMMHSIMNGDF